MLQTLIVAAQPRFNTLAGRTRPDMKVKLKIWAEKNFNPAPCKRTLVKWAKDGKIYPSPTFIGNAYYVEESARYMDDRLSAPPRHDLRKNLAERIAA